ncbi:MAG TPA: MauE/DoxX family redox-associated membrane protein [Rubrobacteraceae bacterium]|nr:MauE/DoxX family redox-associated membrane protein [Rubrobacteraceae bacterium]
MVSLFVLVISFILLRVVGLLGVERLSSWRAASRGALVVMFLFTGTSHFTSMKYDFAAMIPPPLPNDLWVIYLSGLFEIAGAIGLLISRTRKLAGICLVLLLVALFSANVYAALSEVPLRGEAAEPLWIRTPMQVLYIGLVWWTSIKARPKEVGRPRLKERGAKHEQPSRQGASL